MKAGVDDVKYQTLNLKSKLERVGDTVGEEEIAGNQHFLLFPQCFKSSPFGMLKLGTI